MLKDSLRPRSQFLGKDALRFFLIAALALSLGLLMPAQAQTQTAHAANSISAALPDAPAPQATTSDEVSIRNIPRNLLHDQITIWSGPAHIRPHDLKWLLPLAAATGIAFATDQHTMTQVVSHDPSFNQASINTSDVLVGSEIVVPIAVYGFGLSRQDEHAREAGIATGESMVDAFVVGEILKVAFRRERPSVDGARGQFFQSGVGSSSSFPSGHSIVAWSAASALAAEYPSPWMQFSLYSAATGVSLTRVLGQEHFPSDVLVASSIGWLIGHNVVRRHHHHR